MNIDLLRHPKVKVPQNYCYGQLDVNLEDGWQDQLSIIKDQMPQYDIIYTSPSSRCRLCAEFLSEQYIISEQLKELNFGLWEGKLWSEISRAESEAWCQSIIHRSPPQGESFLDLYNRVTDFYEQELKIKAKNKKVLLITHFGVIRSLFSYVHNISMKDALTININFLELRHLI